ncbi:hypothetical protein NL676_020343 [Syzygium grande]|nr:hypothetical protein NL676_020343 [Syzygium grande]
MARTVAVCKDMRNREALHFAAMEGKFEVCKYLLEELELDVDPIDVDGHTETAKYLTEQGAHPAMPEKAGLTALHISAAIGATELLKFLLSKGVHVDSQSNFGTPLIQAAGHAKQDAVNVLLEHHADFVINKFSLAEYDMHTPFLANTFISTENRYHAFLLSSQYGIKPIEVAAQTGHRATVEILFPKTSTIQIIPEWSVDGILQYVPSETGDMQALILGSLMSAMPYGLKMEEEVGKAEESSNKKDASLTKQKLSKVQLCIYCRDLRKLTILSMRLCSLTLKMRSLYLLSGKLLKLQGSSGMLSPQYNIGEVALSCNCKQTAGGSQLRHRHRHRHRHRRRPSAAPSAAARPAAALFYTSRATSPFPTRRPWREFLDLSSFSLPYSPTDAASRVAKNLGHFRLNYAIVTLLAVFLGLLWHPVALMVFTAVLLAWYALYFSVDQPLVVLGRSFDDRVVLAGLSFVTAIALVLTGVGLNVLISLAIGVFVIGLHAGFRNSEDLYVDEEESGLFSVVGNQPLRPTSYTRT